MASIVINGDTSGSVTLQAPATAGATVLTLPSTSGTVVTTSGAQTIEFADGSASAPSITNSGNTNTGMFFPAADTIAFAEGGTEVMRITSTGAVSFGSSGTAYGTSGQYLQSNGNTTPTWTTVTQTTFSAGTTGFTPNTNTSGTVTLAGTLNIANGGTGSTTLTANSVVLGNGTSALSGNLIAPSTLGNVLTSNGTTWTSATPTPSLGVGQTWQFPSRAANVTYTNSTGRPIFIAISAWGTGAINVQFQLTVDGVLLARDAAYEASGTLGASVSAIILAGSTYSISSLTGTLTWAELR
jgi:hypothetical protein